MITALERQPPYVCEANTDLLTHFGHGIMVIDPRHQGFGLKPYSFLDQYANKFYVLSGKQGVFVTPFPVPEFQQRYFRELGIDVAEPISPARNGEGSLIDRIHKDRQAMSILRQANGQIIPYMTTQEVESLGSDCDLEVAITSSTSNHIGNKALFHETLSSVKDDIQEQTGIDVVIPTVGIQAGDYGALEKEYRAMSCNGTKDVMVVAPESASSLGTFRIRAGQDISVLIHLIQNNFSEGTEVLLREYIPHTTSPSMQGIAFDRYEHLYMGGQLITYSPSEHGEEHLEHQGGTVPFENGEPILSTDTLARMHDIHTYIGELLSRGGYSRTVLGFDAVLNLDSDGNIVTLKITEANVHLPSSLAVYAAVSKLFPDGFSGIALNKNVPLKSGQMPEDFFHEMRDRFVHQPNEYGAFLLNGSYSNKIDIIFLARDASHLEQLQIPFQL